jgi:hypothetical protein
MTKIMPMVTKVVNAVRDGAQDTADAQLKLLQPFQDEGVRTPPVGSSADFRLPSTVREKQKRPLARPFLLNREEAGYAGAGSAFRVSPCVSIAFFIFSSAFASIWRMRSADTLNSAARS